MANTFRIPPRIPVQPPTPKTDISKKETNRGQFQEFLTQEIQRQPITFSGHAKRRLEENNIDLNEHQLEQLHEAVNKISQKGGRESLVIIDELAFVVSVPNRTVITVVDEDRLKENVFTQIDSAFIQ